MKLSEEQKKAMEYWAREYFGGDLGWFDARQMAFDRGFERALEYQSSREQTAPQSAQEAVPAKEPDLVEWMIAAYSKVFEAADFQRPDPKYDPLEHKAMAAALRVALEEALGPIAKEERALILTSNGICDARRLMGARLARLLPAQEAKERIWVDVLDGWHRVFSGDVCVRRFGLEYDAKVYADGLRAGIARQGGKG